MPIKKSRYNHTKVYRPNGMRYTRGFTLYTTEAAVGSAFACFEEEFGRKPIMKQTVVEILGVTCGWAATVFEFEDQE